ncbi:very short patch repair endonuclease [Pyruvatibacter mobilis]|uniref:very short patch repair endonuclease n=1 Tax=Pyruvatibacter mobilis TaxID=1712261 RepID=UPI003BAFD8C5
MAAIKGKDTKPELVVRRGLHARGLRFRLHSDQLPGRPDLVFPARRVALFVHGCFWHAHEGCQYFKLPQTDPDRWRRKLEGNRCRDIRNQSALIHLGWRVLVVWECELRSKPEVRLDELAQEIRA